MQFFGTALSSLHSLLNTRLLSINTSFDLVCRQSLGKTFVGMEVNLGICSWINEQGYGGTLLFSFLLSRHKII